MLRYLLDSNAMIAVLNGRSAALSSALHRYNPNEIGISSAVVYELYFGAFRSQRVDSNLEKLAHIRFETLPFDQCDSCRRGACPARGGWSTDRSLLF